MFSPRSLGSLFQRERSEIAEIAVGEAVQESKAGDTVKVGWGSRHAKNGDIVVEAEQRNLYADYVERVGTRVGAGDGNQVCRFAAEKKQSFSSKSKSKGALAFPAPVSAKSVTFCPPSARVTVISIAGRSYCNGH